MRPARAEVIGPSLPGSPGMEDRRDSPVAYRHLNAVNSGRMTRIRRRLPRPPAPSWLTETDRLRYLKKSGPHPPHARLLSILWFRRLRIKRPTPTQEQPATAATDDARPQSSHAYPTPTAATNMPCIERVAIPYTRRACCSSSASLPPSCLRCSQIDFPKPNVKHATTHTPTTLSRIHIAAISNVLSLP